MTKPNPPGHCIKVFAASQVLENSKNSVWPGKITNVIPQHWRGRNLRKKTISGLENGTLDRPSQLRLTQVGSVSVDGSKLAANASKHAAVSYQRAGALLGGV